MTDNNEQSPIDDIIELKRNYNDYIENPLCVYALTLDNESMLIMKKIINETPDTIKTFTNETRKNVVDPMYAKFRANILDLVAIIDLVDFNKRKTTCKFINFHHDSNNIMREYKVGDRIFSDFFDGDINKVISSGIYYYKSIDAAYFNRDPSCYDFSASTNGSWKSWHDNGQMAWKGTFTNGNKNGLWIEWYDNGNKQFEMSYLNGTLDGLWTEWYYNGNVRSKGMLNDDERNGQWIKYYSNGQTKKESWYRDGEKHGLCSSYHIGLKIECQQSYLNGKKDGVCVVRYENDTIKKHGTYKNGNKTGRWIHNYANSKPKSSGLYNDGEKKHKWTYWYENGTIRSTGIYVNGEKSGEWCEWDEYGILIKQNNYDTNCNDSDEKKMILEDREINAAFIQPSFPCVTFGRPAKVKKTLTGRFNLKSVTRNAVGVVGFIGLVGFISLLAKKTINVHNTK